MFTSNTTTPIGTPAVQGNANAMLEQTSKLSGKKHTSSLIAIWDIKMTAKNVNAFLEYFAAKVVSGAASNLSTVEIFAINLYDRWLDDFPICASIEELKVRVTDAGTLHINPDELINSPQAKKQLQAVERLRNAAVKEGETPETDAIVLPYIGNDVTSEECSKLLDHARNLERERNAIRSRPPSGLVEALRLARNLAAHAYHKSSCDFMTSSAELKCSCGYDKAHDEYWAQDKALQSHQPQGAGE